MPIANQGLEKELGCLTKPAGIKHIRGLFKYSAPIMHDIAHCIIAGSAVVGVKFRDNRIYVPEVALATRCVPAAMKVLEARLVRL